MIFKLNQRAHVAPAAPLATSFAAPLATSFAAPLGPAPLGPTSFATPKPLPAADQKTRPQFFRGNFQNTMTTIVRTRGGGGGCSSCGH
jgi:hypothetical protein